MGRKCCAPKCRSGYKGKVFIKSVLIETRSHYTYSSILETSCLQDHPFENIFVNIVTKLFNVMCKNFASEVNSAVHKDKKKG